MNTSIKNMGSTMEVVFCVNNAFAKQLAVTITSILINSHCKINFHILSSNFSEANQKLITNIVHHYSSNSSIEYLCPPSPAILKIGSVDNLKQHCAGTNDSFYRYFIADIFPKLDKALYLDADIIAHGDISPLWNIELSPEFYCAGVPDNRCNKMKYKRKLGYTEHEIYINSGMMLLNLSVLRENNVSKLLVENTQKFTDTDSYGDQDAINRVFKNKIKNLPAKWNFTASHMRHDLFFINRYRAIVLHYTTHKKPWIDGTKCHMRHIWKHYEKLADLNIGSELRC